MTQETINKAKNISRAAMESLMTIFGDTTYVSTLVEDCYAIATWLLNHEHETDDQTLSFLPAIQYGAFAIFVVFAVIDAYVHYIIYSNSRYNSSSEEREEKQANDKMTLLSRPTFATKLLASICTFMCATDTTNVPAIVMTLLNHFNIVPLNIPFRITRTALNIAAAGLSFWSVSGGKYQMAVAHVHEYRTPILTNTLPGGTLQ